MKDTKMIVEVNRYLETVCMYVENKSNKKYNFTFEELKIQDSSEKFDSENKRIISELAKSICSTTYVFIHCTPEILRPNYLSGNISHETLLQDAKELVKNYGMDKVNSSFNDIQTKVIFYQNYMIVFNVFSLIAKKYDCNFTEHLQSDYSYIIAPIGQLNKKGFKFYYENESSISYYLKKQIEKSYYDNMIIEVDRKDFIKKISQLVKDSIHYEKEIYNKKISQIYPVKFKYDINKLTVSLIPNIDNELIEQNEIDRINSIPIPNTIINCAIVQNCTPDLKRSVNIDMMLELLKKFSKSKYIEISFMNAICWHNPITIKNQDTIAIIMPLNIYLK